MPPKKIFERYYNSLDETYILDHFLDQILDLIKTMELGIGVESTNNPNVDCIFSFKKTVESFKELLAESNPSSEKARNPVIEDNIIDSFAEYNDQRFLELINAHKYLKIYIEINNSNIQRSIIKPLTNNIDLEFFYSFLLYINCRVKGYYNQEDLEEIIKVADSEPQHIIKFLEHPDSSQIGTYHPVIDLIIGLLLSKDITPDFYIDDLLIKRILEVAAKYTERDYCHYIDLCVVHARHAFEDNAVYKHPVYEVSEIHQKTLGKLPQLLINSTIISDWPSIKLTTAGCTEDTIPISLSINDLAKFQAHLLGSRHIRFSLKISQLEVGENEKLNDALIQHLSNCFKGFNPIGSGGAIRLPAFFKYHPIKLKGINPTKLVEELSQIVTKYCSQNHNHIKINEELLKTSLEKFFNN